MPHPIQYTISPSSPYAHIFSVKLIVQRPDPKGQLLSLPAWIPGSYMIRDFAKNIISIKAHSENDFVALSKTDKQTWLAAPVSGALVVEYEVYAWDLSVRGAHLDVSHGFFNGTSVFLRVLGQEEERSIVTVSKPEGEQYLSWKLATSMPARSVDEQGFGARIASDYESLIDYPVEMGDFQELEFKVQNVPHRMVLTGRCTIDKQRIADDLQKICSYHTEFFGVLPVDQYLFLTMVVGEGYGGLEHLDSTSLMCKRADLPTKGMKEVSEGYCRFLGLCSHEYFHLWNVKRIRPEILKRADLSQEVHTELLWAFEGITSYYDDLALVRSGCIEVSSYLDLIAHTISQVMGGGGRFRQSVADSSFDAWTRFYKQDENAPNAIVSYYSKGALVAFGLDMMFRELSADKLSLDHFMVKLWECYGKSDIGVPERGLENLASEMLGIDLSEFFAEAVYGTADLPLESWFTSLGIGYRLRPQKDQEDLGGYCDKPGNYEHRLSIGARYKQQGDMVVLTHVLVEGAAQSAGLAAGDKLVAINGLQVNSSNLSDLIAQVERNEGVEVIAFRRDELMSFDLQPKTAPMNACELWLMPDDDCDKQQLARRQKWLALE